MTDKLSSCPFCGKRLERSADLSNRRSDTFIHPQADAVEDTCFLEGIMVAISDREGDFERVQKWNRRAPSAEPKGLGSK